MKRAPAPPPNDPLESARSALQRLRQSDDWDEPTPVVHVHAHAPPAPPPPRTPPAPPPTALQVVLQVFLGFPKWGAVIVAIVALLVYAYLALHGKAPAPAP